MKGIKELTLKEVQDILGYEVKIVVNKSAIKLADIPVGETFKVGDLEFIVLEHHNDSTSVLLKDFWKTSIFDSDLNNYADSEIRKDLNKDFYKRLKSLIGEENILQHEVNLVSDDGRKEYGVVKDYVSLLTCDMYRKYVEIIDKYRITSDWWWLSTPYSTKSYGYGSRVRGVCRDGALYYDSCFSNLGVRPFLILKSDIFIS